MAAALGHIEVVMLLLDAGADVNPKADVSDVIWGIVLIVFVVDCAII